MESLTTEICMLKVQQSASEKLVPRLPRDIIRYEDGTWLCSSADTAKLKTVFSRFGLRLKELSGYDELVADMRFIIRTASLINSRGASWIKASHPVVYLDYLSAVHSGNSADVARALSAYKAKYPLEPHKVL